MLLRRSILFFCFLFMFCAVQMLAPSGEQAQERIRVKLYDGPDLPDDSLAVLAIDDFGYFPNSINGKDLRAIFQTSGTSSVWITGQKRVDLLLAPGVQTLAVNMNDYRAFDDFLRGLTIELAPGVQLPAGRPTDIRALDGLESNSSIRFEALPGHRYRIVHKAIPLIKKDNILYFFHFTKLCVVEDLKGANQFIIGAFRECLNLRPEDETKPVSTDMKNAHLYVAESPLPPESAAIVRIGDDGLCVDEITGTTNDQQQIVCHARFFRSDWPTIYLKPGVYSFSASYSVNNSYRKAKSTTNATAELHAEAGRVYLLKAKIRGGGKWSIQFKE